MPQAPLLELHRVSLRDGDQAVLTDVSLTVNEAEVVGVVLQHGAGKSVLLRVASGLLPPTSGAVIYRGRRIEELPASPPKLGFVFEDDGGLLANLSLFDNVALPLRYHFDLDDHALEAKVREVLGLVGLDEHTHRMPFELTRDRQRLAALARAIAYEPELIFVDDFYVSAEADEQVRRMQESIDIAREAHGTAFLLAMEAGGDASVADRLCLVDHGAVLELDQRL
ncbi:MAG: ATP-binding cassette domain-containing protein [Myxococcales bacterium]|nr:ATP-binding cassette domain-containing protein [Myxococcales bacterium]